MGLDNGIIIKPKNEDAEIFLEKNCNHFKEDIYSDPTYEPVYWRKCWNLRNAMFENGLATDGSHHDLKIEDLKTVIEKVIKPFLNEDYWNEDNRSIWSWTQMVRQLGQEIFNLRYFIDDVEDEDLTDEDFEIYFYDSY